MSNKGTVKDNISEEKLNFYERFSVVSNRILRFANKGIPRIEFLHELTEMLTGFTGCDSLELWVEDGKHCYRWEKIKDGGEEASYQIMRKGREERDEDNDLKILYRSLMESPGSVCRFFSSEKSAFYTGNVKEILTERPDSEEETIFRKVCLRPEFRSVTVIPFTIDDNSDGILIMKCRQGNFFSKPDIRFYRGFAQSLGMAIADRRAQSDLVERVKELSCLYKIAQAAEKPGKSLDDIIQNIVDVLPPGWQYPDITTARIILDGKLYQSANFKEGMYSLEAPIILRGKEKAGRVQVFYTEECPELDEGPFLTEERHLIDAISRQVAFILERKRGEEDKSRLQEQLRHADRLATIGQLAAGVAHELNEPLGNILGFAQLALKSESPSPQVFRDIRKIETASLHAREVIRKLMIFSRQKVPEKKRLALNRVVEEGLFFLESRCAKEGIKLNREFVENIPEITADPSQIHQVLVNLVVNAVHAMPDGGEITIRTGIEGDSITLSIADTGTGMDEQVKKQLFIPFFTTKDVGQGTGLGLSVVHGIVTSHGGSIEVETEPGKGSRFEIKLPLNRSDNTNYEE